MRRLAEVVRATDLLTPRWCHPSIQVFYFGSEFSTFQLDVTNDATGNAVGGCFAADDRGRTASWTDSGDTTAAEDYYPHQDSCSDHYARGAEWWHVRLLVLVLSVFSLVLLFC